MFAITSNGSTTCSSTRSGNEPTSPEEVSQLQSHTWPRVERARNGSVIVVGHNPCLTARKVKNFAVGIDKKTDKEIIVADGLESSHVMDFCDMIGVGTGN